ncbi:MAG: hypothetical protein ACXVPU_03760 [Bacteroidia bacterium]
MAEIVKTKNQSDPVTIKITANSAAFWEYNYEDRGTSYSGKYNDGKAHEHAIGLPAELHMSHDTWVFRFINTTGASTGYSAKIEWFQNAELLHTWIKNDNVPSDSPAQITDECYIV